MSDVKDKFKDTDVKIAPELEQRVLFSILEDISSEKEILAQQTKVNFSLLEDINAERIRINATIQNLNEGVVAFDANGNVILVNPMITKLTGLPEKGFSIVEFTSLFKGIDVEAKIKSALANRQKTHIEEITLIGRFFYEMFFTPIIDSQDNTIGSAIVINDITQLKEIERAKSEFISIASHQLRTPLTGIRWTIERILKNENLTIGLQGYLQDIHVSVQRLSDLVTDLLNTSRFEEGKLAVSPKQIELVAFIRDYIIECTPLFIKKGLALTFEEYPETLNIITDPNILRNVIQSLVSNAIEYTPKGGKVKVFLERKPSAASAQDSFLFTVSDTGIGIPKEEQAAIFEKFGRASNAKLIKPSGSGLGLYLGKQAAETLGGKIWFESPALGRDKEEKKGTTFYVELPIESKSIEGTKQLV